MITAIGFFILGTILWAFNHDYNPSFDYGIGLVLLGLYLPVKDSE